MTFSIRLLGYYRRMVHTMSKKTHHGYEGLMILHAPNFDFEATLYA